MPDTTLTAREPAAVLDLSTRNGHGRELSVVNEDTINYSSYSTLERLPGSTTTLSIETTGEELGRLFTMHPELPGVILFDESRFAGVISQAHYYKCISRAFGREIYYRRSSAIMLKDISVQPLVLSSICTIHHAVEQCLTRPVDYVYEPFLIHNEASGQYRLCAFQNLLLASSQLATLRNRQMEQILNSVTDGLLVIDRNFRIGSEHSKIVDKIFERTDFHGASLPEVLQPLIDNVTHEQLMDYLKILFDPKLIDRLIKSINPAKQITASFPSSAPEQKNRVKHFAFNFERIRTQSEISQVLVRIEDITQQINLAKELEQQEAAAEEKLQLVMQILQVEPEALNRFLKRFDEAVTSLSGMLGLSEGGELSRDAIHALFRLVHTLKGEAALLRLNVYERTLHQLEDRLQELRSATQLKAESLVFIRPFGERLQRLSDQIHEALEQLKVLGARTAVTTSAAAAVAKPAGLLETVSRLVADLSERLGKPATFHAAVQESDFPESYAAVLHEILLHLARNSMVHGIEAAGDRAARGKHAQGLIQLDLRSHPEFHEVIFQDDGKGLDYDKIRQRAAQLGWNLATEEELRNAIFEPGFSTMDKVTDLAGRGVGLDVIRHSLSKVGGRIQPYSEPGAYCAFQILLPKTPTSLVA